MPTALEETAAITGDRRDTALARFHQNTRLAFAVVSRFRRKAAALGLPIEDLSQLALAGLWVGAATFDPNRGAKFSTHAMWKILASVSRGLAQVPGYKSVDAVSSSAGRGNFPGPDGLLNMIPTRDSDPLADANRKAQLTEAVNQLHQRYRRVLTLRYGLGDGRDRTLAEVGAALGMTRERARQLEQTALVALHRACRRMGMRRSEMAGH
ncbi:hypothetical protein AYO44_03835 [Planctomycetaceae bacterium SCGC AG-212-F19]|nr:hypothetical protein AYO44_03835 [Planctomycetaceae bacterium SCGC AG-212-F19]